ncbi:TIGR00725 family protein [Dissulfurispira sp.]|uniref:TIGR00725 family protein n=1 Tax=Dissulfurispira sp. TaxID=2817609 RepID=UPI002FD8D7F8
MQQKIIAVIGAGNSDENTLRIAEEVGKLIARRNAILICGGLGGVMEAAAKGAKSEGGITVGILPQSYKSDANPYIDVPVATGFGEGRNVIIVRSADALIAVGGEYGTLSEIALGLKTGKPVIGINTWDIKGIIKADDAEDAVNKALAPLAQ